MNENYFVSLLYTIEHLQSTIMSEDFLHYIWRSRNFDGHELMTTNGIPIEIIHPGTHNTHAGPDFVQAQVRIGDIRWAGNVEIHLQASQWAQHRHQHDKAYNNVVLHVVLEADKPAFNEHGEEIPCLSLSNRLPTDAVARYEQLMEAALFVPCERRLKDVPTVIHLQCHDRMLVERMEEKTATVAHLLAQTNNHWGEAFYMALARNFGLKVNADPFEELARSLPFNIILRHTAQPLQVEALLFGQAGFLTEQMQEPYPEQLRKEYHFLRQKYQLQPLDRVQWKMLRLRPAGFPTIRIAQFAYLLSSSEHLFSKILEANTVRQLEHLFYGNVNEYWQTHYTFETVSAKRQKHLGKAFIHLIIINTIVPFLYHYGNMRQLSEYKERSMRLLEQLPGEANSVLDAWAQLGMTAKDAWQSQALLHLHKHYCSAKRCTNCNIGNYLLK
jgi:hypothetical protein